MAAHSSTDAARPLTVSAAAPAPDPELIAVARGEAPADLVLAGGQVVNVFTREIIPADIAILHGRIASVGVWKGDARRTIDATGAILAPGFIDAHMHIESTMLPPSRFAALAVPHGTTGVVADPHEIANVHGIDGIRFMIRDAAHAACRIFFTASSCVPSCHLENAGATLTAADLAPLFDDPRVIALAEMMNFPGVIHADPAVLAKVALGLRHGRVDGHAPGVRGAALQAYAAAGISSDHESVSIDEARDKLRAGMQVFIREGSAARNLGALLPLITPANAHRFCWCTDDRHPADLRTQGHIDHVIRRAIAAGLDPATAIAIGSFHTASHFGLRALGALAPGYHADIVILDSLRDLRIREVLIAGEPAARGDSYLHALAPLPEFPRRSVRLPADLSEHHLRIAAPTTPARIRVIDMDPHQIVTGRSIHDARIASGAAIADPARDILKMAVIERHSGSGAIGLGFVRGFRFSGGAIASTVGHDAHNLAIVGDSDTDMILAARELERVGGGQTVVSRGKVLATLPLPIAGLMADREPDAVIADQAALLRAAAALGCPHHDPFMPLSFLCLPVIPALKLTDLGLVDVDRFAVVPLFEPA
jgi:adenine deaminase